MESSAATALPICVIFILNIIHKFPLKLFVRKSIIHQSAKMFKIISVKTSWIHTEASPWQPTCNKTLFDKAPLTGQGWFILPTLCGSRTVCYQHRTDYDTVIRRQVFSLKRRASEQKRQAKPVVVLLRKCVSGDNLSLTEYSNVSVSTGPRKTSAS